MFAEDSMHPLGFVAHIGLEFFWPAFDHRFSMI
jgi:hypothetical protein